MNGDQKVDIVTEMSHLREDVTELKRGLNTMKNEFLSAIRDLRSEIKGNDINGETSDDATVIDNYLMETSDCKSNVQLSRSIVCYDISDDESLDDNELNNQVDNQNAQQIQVDEIEDEKVLVDEIKCEYCQSLLPTEIYESHLSDECIYVNIRDLKRNIEELKRKNFPGWNKDLILPILQMNPSNAKVNEDDKNNSDLNKPEFSDVDEIDNDVNEIAKAVEKSLGKKGSLCFTPATGPSLFLESSSAVDLFTKVKDSIHSSENSPVRGRKGRRLERRPRNSPIRTNRLRRSQTSSSSSSPVKTRVGPRSRILALENKKVPIKKRKISTESSTLSTISHPSSSDTSKSSLSTSSENFEPIDYTAHYSNLDTIKQSHSETSSVQAIEQKSPAKEEWRRGRPKGGRLGVIVDVDSDKMTDKELAATEPKEGAFDAVIRSNLEELTNYIDFFASTEVDSDISTVSPLSSNKSSPGEKAEPGEDSKNLSLFFNDNLGEETEIEALNENWRESSQKESSESSLELDFIPLPKRSVPTPAMRKYFEDQEPKKKKVVRKGPRKAPKTTIDVYKDTSDSSEVTGRKRPVRKRNVRKKVNFVEDYEVKKPRWQPKIKILKVAEKKLRDSERQDKLSQEKLEKAKAEAAEIAKKTPMPPRTNKPRNRPPPKRESIREALFPGLAKTRRQSAIQEEIEDEIRLEEAKAKFAERQVEEQKAAKELVEFQNANRPFLSIDLDDATEVEDLEPKKAEDLAPLVDVVIETVESNNEVNNESPLIIVDQNLNQTAENNEDQFIVTDVPAEEGRGCDTPNLVIEIVNTDNKPLDLSGGEFCVYDPGEFFASDFQNVQEIEIEQNIED